MPTRTDVSAPDWRINDAPFRLRLWASNREADVYQLPMSDGEESIVGSGDNAQIRLSDPKQLLSQKHASIAREHGRYALRDFSKNGTRVDGERRSLCLLEPGLEIEMGSFTFVAESPRFLELRAFVSRMIGGSGDAMESVDLALRALRTAAARRAPLVLCGAGDVTALAHDLHRRTHGTERPFVVCDPRRREGDATVRSAPNVDSGLAAIEAARGGTVCIWAKRRPADLKAMTNALRNPSSRVQLIVCADKPAQCKAFQVTPIVVPAVSTRGAELTQIINEYEADARELLMAEAALTQVDRDWIASRSAQTLPSIAIGTLRLVALRQAGSVNAAADLLGMSHTSLLRWLGRRRLWAAPAKRRGK